MLENNLENAEIPEALIVYTGARATRNWESYDRIVEDLQDARTNSEPLLSHLKAIEQLLQGNPTAADVAKAKDTFMKANWRCIDVQRSLMEVEAEFTFLAADFAQHEKE